jgi:hypothetical protein
MKRLGYFGIVAALLVSIVLAGPARKAMAYYFSIDGTVSASFTANDRRTVGINANANLPVNVQPATSFTNGTGANQAQVLYQASRTLSGSTDSVDINGATINDSYGTPIALTAVKALYIQNLSSSNTITVGGASSNPWTGLFNSTGTFTLQPGDWIVVCTPTAAGWAASSTSKIIQVAGTSGQSYQIALLGLGT